MEKLVSLNQQINQYWLEMNMEILSILQLLMAQIYFLKKELVWDLIHQLLLLHLIHEMEKVYLEQWVDKFDTLIGLKVQTFDSARLI